MLRFKWTFLLAILFGQAAQGQQPLQFPFVHYGENEGLAATYVHCAVQDSTGYIWIGTEAGLQRYDGNRYMTFRNDPNVPGTIPNNNVHSIVYDRRGNCWTTFDNGQLGVFNTATFRFTNIPVQSSNSAILRDPKVLRFDSKGNVFFVSDGSLFVYRPNQPKTGFDIDSSFVKVPPGRRLFQVIEDAESGKYWMGTDSGLAVYDSKTGNLSDAFRNTDKNPVIEAFSNLRYAVYLFIDSQRRLWILNWPPNIGATSIHMFALNKDKVLKRDYNLMGILRVYHEIYGLMEQKDGSIWLYGSPVLAKFDEKKGEFRAVLNGYQNEYSISYDAINCVVEDREANLWVCTDNNGLYRFNPSEQYFKNIRVTNRLNGEPGNGSVLSFNYDDDGSILVGAWANGIYRYDSALNNIPLSIKGIPEQNGVFAWTMLRSPDHRSIWMGCQPGLYAYDIATRSVRYFNPPLLKKKTVRRLAIDSAGNMWMGMHGTGVYKWTINHTGVYDYRNVKHMDNIPSTVVTSLVVARNGYVWIGLEAAGVFVVDPASDSVILHLRSNGPEGEKLMDDRVNAILQYDDSTIIIAAGGLNLYNTNNGSMRSIALPGNLSPVMASMEKSKDGHLWMSFSSGLCRVNLRQKIFIHFHKIDGIVNDHFRIGSSRMLPDGRMLFGSTNQFVVFDPKEVNVSSPAPGVVITDVKVMNRSLLVDSLMRLDKLELLPSENSLAIEFSGLNYNGTYLIRYKLDGLDRDWKIAGKANQAVYSYLPPGTYTFMARTQDAEGRLGPQSTQLVIKIKPPFWRTWWFASLIIFALMGILYWLDKLRTQKIRATESIRTRIATSLTEDMSNSLSSINISSELAKTKIDTDPARTKEYIGQISDTSNRMVQSMYDMVWSINPENDTMRHSIERMRSFVTEIDAFQHIQIVFDIDKSVVDPEIDMENRYEMLAIFKEAVTNAVKHSGAKHVQISIRYKKPKLTLLVQDDGKGFDVSAAELGRGLSDMRRRAAAINAEFLIQSEINTGTCVKLVMTV